MRGRWGNTPPGAHNSGTPVSIACSPDSGFAHTGHGSLHVDFKANTEAWRSFRGGRPAANSMHRPRGCGEEAHPPTLDHHSLRCQLTPRPGRRGMPLCIQLGTHPGKSPRLVLYLLFARRVCMCEVCRPSPHCGVGCGACCTGPTCLDSCFRVFWPETVDPSRAALAPSPKATLRVANAFSNKCQVEG